MPEDFNQKISQFLDNELDDVHALSLLKKMQMQPELQDKLNRYEAISHAMKTDVFLLTRADFSTKIRQKVQQEPHASEAGDKVGGDRVECRVVEIE